jgi:2-polyprenyl-6-methoxyphenol hydroxylase-like FAD-dependent oxidoreductase
MNVEIVVLGAGVAGLLIASELALRHDVLVLERASTVPSTKFWLTDRGSVNANPDLAPALDSVYETMAFTAYEGTTYTVPGDFCMWDSARLLSALTSKLVQRNGRIEFGQRFYSLRADKTKATIYANDRRIDCRLVIDCMGVGSPIIYAKGIVDVLGFYLLHGATFPLRERIAPVVLHNLMLSHQPGWIEAFPTADDQLHLVLIVPTSNLRPASDLKADFTFIATRSPYARCIDASGRGRRFLGGVVAVARMRRRAMNRVFFFGEAGQVNPAASATALTRMLYNHRAIAAHLTECLRGDDMTAAALCRHRAPAVSPFNERLQRALFRSILRWNSDDYLLIVQELIAMNDPVFVNHLMFGDMPGDIPAISRYAARLCRTRSWGLLRSILKGVTPSLI